MSAPAEELLDAQTGVPRPASRPLLDVEHANTCSVVVPDTDSDDDDDLFEETSSHTPDIHAENSPTERLFQPTNHQRSSHRHSNTSSSVLEETSNNCSSPNPEDSLTSNLFEDNPHFISAQRRSNTDSSLFEDPSGHCSETETETARPDGQLNHRNHCTASVAFVQEKPPTQRSDIDNEQFYFNKVFEPPLSCRKDCSDISRQYSHTSSVFQDTENCPHLEESYLDKVFEPPESHRDDIRGSRRKRINTSSSVYASPLTQTPEPNAINKFEESYFERLFERPKNQQTQSNTGGREYPQCYRHSLPPSLNQGVAESTMSHQLSEPNCVNAVEVDVDPNVSHRILELVNALAQVGQGQQEHSGNNSEEEDAEDIRSGCQINLAFEDTEPDLPFNPRYIDITKSDCDHLPWYFQDSEDDISHLIYPEEELSSKRPHSIAVPSELVSTLNENADFLRSRPMRSTVGSSKRAQEFHVPERPVSAAEFSGHGPSVSSSKSGFLRSSPVRATVGAPSRCNGSSRLSDEQALNENDTPTILENLEFTRSNSTRYAVGVNSRSRDLDSYTPVYQTSGFAVGKPVKRSHSDTHYQQVPDTGDKRPLCQDVDEIMDAAESGSVNQLFDERTFQQVPEFDHKVSERSAECSPAYVRNSRQLYESSHQVPEGDPDFSKSFSKHFRQVSEPNHQSPEGNSETASAHDRHPRHLSEPDHQTPEVDTDVVMPLDQHFRQVSEPYQHPTGRNHDLYLRRASEPTHFAQSFDRVVPEPSAPSEEELDSPVLLRTAHLRATSTAGQPTIGSFVRASRQSSSMGHPRRESSGDADGEGNRTSTESSDEIDWSWVAGEARRLEAAEAGVSRPSSWVRASMRRVQHFRLEEPRVRSAPPETIAPLPPLSAQVVPELETTGSTAVPTGGGRDFPRRYSASPLHRQVVASPEIHRPPHPRRRSRSISSSAARQTDGSGAGRRRSRSSSTCSTAQDRRRRGSYRPSSSSESSEDAPSPTLAPGGQTDSGAESDHATNGPCDGRSTMADEAHSPLGHWPHNLSSMLATLGCTLGLFNISRFAIFSVQFGANFIIQFIFLTLVLGFPLYTFHVSIGQLLAAGVMDMWRISPIFQGIGIALLVSQALIGIYSIVGVSWMFIYFRDSFITKQDRYRWAEPYELYREDSTVNVNGSWHLEETVPDYLNGVVLQRHSTNSSENTFGHLKFQVTFNLAVVWMIVFVSLSKGLRSYGKVVYVFSLFPVFGMLILCTKLLGLTPTDTSHQVFPETVWSEFFLNTKCWVAAATEVFFTWGLLGAAMMQISSHNRHKHLLQRDVTLVMILTLAILLLAAFLANTCMLLLASKQYTYVPSSFEHMNVYTFLKPEGTSMSPMYAKTPVRFMTHSTFIVGCRIILPDVNSNQESGYQVLRLATEVVPATFALLGADQVSPFWAVLFYFVLILFGIAQQLAIWHCVITGIMAINAVSLKSWETTITFFSCACGFILGLPMTTELGIFVVYFLDYTVGSAWWIMVLYLLEIGAVFVVRGRPYNGENVVSSLFNKGVGCLQVWAAPMLVFTWNVILPVALMVLCITVFKNGKFRELYNWHSAGYENWPLWAREVGCLLQLLPIIAIPLVGIVQSCRYLSDGPPDLFDRIQLLYRPPLDNEESREQTRPNNTTSANANTGTSNVSTTPAEAAFEDPPPKYTPPPSYTTATGARIAKLLRQSFRRSMRRITSVLGDNTDGFGSTSPRQRASLPPPPDYAAVLVEINQALQNRDQSNSGNSGNVAITITDVDPVRTNASAGNSGFVQGPNMRHLSDTRMSTLTAADVTHILRSSLRRTLQRSSVRGEGGREGNEQLVQGAAPINHDQAKTEQDTSVI